MANQQSTDRYLMQRHAVASLIGECESLVGKGILTEPAEKSMRLLIAKTLAAFGMDHHQDECSMSSHDHSYHPVLGKFLGQPNRAQHVANMEDLKAAYSRIDELAGALVAARCQLVTLGGNEPEGCQIQQAVLSVIDEALS